MQTVGDDLFVATLVVVCRFIARHEASSAEPRRLRLYHAHSRTWQKAAAHDVFKTSPLGTYTKYLLILAVTAFNYCEKTMAIRGEKRISMICRHNDEVSRRTVRVTRGPAIASCFQLCKMSFKSTCCLTILQQERVNVADMCTDATEISLNCA